MPKNKIYSADEAKKIKERLESKRKARENVKALARQKAENIKHDIEIDALINHDDKLYFESLDL